MGAGLVVGLVAFSSSAALASAAFLALIAAVSKLPGLALIILPILSAAPLPLDGAGAGDGDGAGAGAEAAGAGAAGLGAAGAAAVAGAAGLGAVAEAAGADAGLGGAGAGAGAAGALAAGAGAVDVASFEIVNEFSPPPFLAAVVVDVFDEEDNES